MEKKLKSVYESTFHVFGVDVKCHVLNDGQRVIEAESMNKLLNAMADPDVEVGDMESFAKWQKGLLK